MPAAARSAVLSRYGFSDYAFGGAIMLLAAAFFVFMQVRTGTGSLSDYGLVVQLQDAGGLKTGSDVRLSGIKVGRVTALVLGPLNRFALVQISVRDDLALPTGSTFSIVYSPLSDPYLSVTPGKGYGFIPKGGLVSRPERRQDVPSAMREVFGFRLAEEDCSLVHSFVLNCARSTPRLLPPRMMVG